MAKKSIGTSQSIEEKLQNLYELQLIDSKLNNIKKLQGELPLEVSELENEITALDKRIVKMEDELKELQAALVLYENQIKESEALIEKYNKQQDNVKNNREFEALTREVELQKLDIQLSQKRIRETQQKLSNKEMTLDASKGKRAEKEKEMDVKKDELLKITAKTEKEEEKYVKKEKRARKKIDEPMLDLYDKLMASYKNKLAVVAIERDSCGGCYTEIPAQMQLELAQAKKIIFCEHCARVLVAPNGIEFNDEEGGGGAEEVVIEDFE